MTNRKHPSFIPASRHSPDPARRSEPDGGLSALPTAADDTVRIRAANTPAGLLSLREPERLRRYILDASDESQQAFRQQALLDQSFFTLSTWPGPSPFPSHSPSSSSSPVQNSRVVNLGLFAWPVVVCLERSLQVKHTISLGHSADDPFLATLADAWAEALGVASADVRAEGAVSVQRLAGLSPLMLQSSLSNEARRLSPRMGRARTPAAASPCVATSCGHPKPAPWSLILDAQQDLLTPLEPDQPVVFMLTAYVAWDYALAHPTYQDPDGEGTRRMHELMTAVFTHGLKPSLDAPVSADAVSPAISNRREPRTPIKPFIRLGRPQPLHDAVTQGQWMQMAWMAERARKSDRQFSVSLAQQGSFLTWKARLLNDRGEENTALSYTYDGFWRPVGHVQTILNRVDLAQGTGQMPTEDRFSQLMH